MNERERLELIMRCYNLTPSQFADKTGIQRASVSHILSGRNKASLEVMLKIYDAFPSLDMKWLMTGNGDAPVAGMRPVVETPVVQEASVLFPPEAVEEPFVPQVVEQQPVKQQKVAQQPRVATERVQRRVPQRAEKQPAQATQRTIKEIRIYYSDGTFEIMLPEK